jgi:phenylalanyl-tRNA synthetase alpha chain
MPELTPTQELYLRLQKLMAEAETLFPTLTDEAALRRAKAALVGKEGTYTELLRQLGPLPGRERAEAGRRLNEGYQRIEATFNTRLAELTG